MGFLLDIEDGADLVHTFTNTTITRVANVDGLEGSDLDAMLWDALQVLANLGTTDPPLLDIVLGSLHPTVPVIVVTSFDVTPVKACARARVNINYGIPRVDVPLGGAAVDGVDHKTVRYFSRIRNLTADPLDDADFLVQPPPKYAALGAAGNQIKTVPVPESNGVITFQRSEPVVPTARMRAFQGLTNSVQLPLVSPLYPVETLLCNVIQADTQDAGGLYLVRYEFLYNAKGHGVEYKWEKPPLNVPDYDADSRKTRDYDSIDFASLGLDFSD
jgi:hypothetical protein